VRRSVVNPDSDWSPHPGEGKNRIKNRTGKKCNFRSELNILFGWLKASPGLGSFMKKYSLLHFEVNKL
jgi:hypothetical protein